MTGALPPLDMHAHIEPRVSARELEGLGAVVFAATRSGAEFEAARARSDLVTIWGVGCHPGVPGAHHDFDTSRFSELMDETPLVSEIGLDGTSKVPLGRQVETFTAILSLIRSKPRLTSVHSFGATGRVLDCIERSGVRGAILHWWLGSATETERGLALGCYFSVNHSMLSRPELLRLIPVDRLLLETDHPAGDRRSNLPRQPGAVADVESRLGGLHRIDADEFRRSTWQNLSRITSGMDFEHMLPRPIRAMLQASTSEG